MTTPLVIAHGSCQDGFGAAWACWKAHPDWEFTFGVHGTPPPDVTGREVYLLDFSYKRPVLEQMAEQAISIQILDHHVTAAAELQSFQGDPDFHVEVTFDMEKSGARLAWEHFHPGVAVPKMILHIEDRDLWRFALDGTRDISAVIFSYEYDFYVWDWLAELCETNTDRMILEGMAISRQHMRDVRELVKATKRRMTIGGVEVWAANIPYTLTSDAGHLMCEAGEPFAACYWDTPDGRTFSLRSRDDGADVSEIAKRYGGGGHKHAAGFQTPLPAAHWLYAYGAPPPLDAATLVGERHV